MARHQLNIDGWNLEYNDYEGHFSPCISAEKGDVDVDVDDGQLCIEWTEPSDYYGTATRSVRVPVAVLEQLLEWSQYSSQYSSQNSKPRAAVESPTTGKEEGN
jgi:hypothetical protein